MSGQPSVAIAESPAHRTAIARRIEAETGLNEALLQRLVRAFYAAARKDPEIGPLFDAVDDWAAHIATFTNFWSSVVLMAGSYRG